MKRDIFSELMDGLEALAEERKGKVTLKKNARPTNRNHEGQTHTSQ